MVALKEVLTNIKNFSGWNYTNYPLRKDEADAILEYISTTNKQCTNGREESVSKSSKDKSE